MNPWRAVKDARIRTKSCKPGRGAQSRTWELTLECGHRVSRYVTGPEDNKKPKKARCYACGFREARG